MDKTNSCRICDFTSDSSIDMNEHILEDHTLRERLDALQERRMPMETKA